MSDTPILQSGLDALARVTGAIPPDKNHAVVVAYDKKGLVPWVRVGWASRVNNAWTIGTGIEARAKERPTLHLYTAWTWLLLLCLLVPVPAAAQPASYPGTLVRVVDGDTYVIRVDFPFNVSYTATIRLADLDTPERFTAEGKAATAAVTRLLESGPITVAPTGKMTFARHVAHVYVGGVSVAETLERAGYGRAVRR